MLIILSPKKCLLLILQALLMITITSKINNVRYTELPPDTEDSILPNPERGFYRQYSYHSSNPHRLSTNALKSLRKDPGLTIILRLYYLNTFLSESLSKDFLDDFEADMGVLRDSGTKAILRFAYTDCINSFPRDAKVDKVLEHIKQLKHYLQSNIDVIMTVQSGFVGTWGEWYFSTNFGNPDNSEPPDWAKRSRVVDALLDAVPSSRYIQIRTPQQKKNLTGETAPLTENIAHSGIKVARLGHHNDCFLASDTDYGTYTNPNQTEYPYLESETRFTIMGGETCKSNSPRSDCATAMKEMKLFSYTYMNLFYHPSVLNSWLGNCRNEIFDRLGYRIVLKYGAYEDQVYRGEQGGMNFDLTLKNIGFAAPITSRKMNIILKQAKEASNDPSAESVSCSGTVPSFDLLNLYADKEVSVKARLQLPSSVDPGLYNLFIKFPDKFPNLSMKSEYNIAVANVGINNYTSGLIKLLDQVEVLSGFPSGMGPEENLGENRDLVTLSCNLPTPPTPTPPTLTTGESKSLLSVKSFEGPISEIKSKWKDFRKGYNVTTEQHHSNKQSIIVKNGGGARQILTFGNNPIPSKSTITISGYSKASDIYSKIKPGDYAIYVDITFLDDSHLWARKAPFRGGTHDWEQSSFTFYIEKPIKKMVVIALYRNDPGNNGEAYFDDVDVTVKLGATMEGVSRSLLRGHKK